MKLYHNHSSLRILCVRIFTLGVISIATASYSQVPTGIPASKNLASTENAIPAGHTVVKVMTAESAIPFGIMVGSGNSAVLDMKGNDQEFARKFTFKNTSSGTYTINSIDFEKLDNGFEFLSVEPAESFPFEIAPGQTFAVRVAFRAKGRDILCTNTLKITTEENKQPITYQVQAMQQPLSALPWNKKNAVAQVK
jgi:hypothetical protein